MAIGKWIGGIVGFMSGGPLGALAGIVLGGVLDSMLDGVNTYETQGTFDGYSGYQQAAYQSRAAQGQRNSFLFSMLVLSSYVIKADGKVMHSEMEVVRNMLRQNFGEVASQQGDEILRRLFDEQKRVGEQHFKNTVADCCRQIAMNMDYSQRLQLLNFLVMISQADGRVDDVEVKAMKECAQWMQMSADDVDSMLGMGKDDLESAYQVLGVSPDATDAEVKRAYRNLALNHHPDKVAALGEDVRKAAEKKFQEINNAKERIWKARGL
jgi:DnaJ like chaperone protein